MWSRRNQEPTGTQKTWNPRGEAGIGIYFSPPPPLEATCTFPKLVYTHQPGLRGLEGAVPCQLEEAMSTCPATAPCQQHERTAVVPAVLNWPSRCTVCCHIHLPNLIRVSSPNLEPSRKGSSGKPRASLVSYYITKPPHSQTGESNI